LKSAQFKDYVDINSVQPQNSPANNYQPKNPDLQH
jgi:hypothetical protein